jgi:predicted RNA-binding Zn-ribbon protein involved in translation (DUF1610 family)
MIEQKLRAFMYGRYGMDQLNIALLVIYTVLILINFFTDSVILFAFELAVLAWELFRFFSRKVYVRQKENAVFMKAWTPVKKWFISGYIRFKERDVYKYRKCPNCKATLRLPNRKGKHTTKCPRCGNEFEVRI